eukprot:580236-Prymnesium_polylepis.1
MRGARSERVAIRCRAIRGPLFPRGGRELHRNCHETGRLIGQAWSAGERTGVNIENIGAGGQVPAFQAPPYHRGKGGVDSMSAHEALAMLYMVTGGSEWATNSGWLGAQD